MRKVQEIKTTTEETIINNRRLASNSVSSKYSEMIRATMMNMMSKNRFIK